MYVHVFIHNSFGFVEPTIELEEKAIDMNCEMVQRMTIAQRRLVQVIDLAIGNYLVECTLCLQYFTLFLYTFLFFVELWECNVFTCM